MFKIQMQLERETKGALRYQEVDEHGRRLEIGDGAKIGVLYIRKSSMQGVPPSLIVTVTEV